MREFFFNNASKVLDDPKVVQVLIALYEYKGKQVLYLQARPDVLESLCEFAKAQSTGCVEPDRGHLDVEEAPGRLWQTTRGRRIATSKRSRGTATYLPKCAVLIELKHLTRPAPGPSLCRVPPQA